MTLIEILESIRTYDCPGCTPVKIGSTVLLKELCKSTDVVYVYGAGKDIAFGEELLKLALSAKLCLFDPSVDELSAGQPFYKEGITISSHKDRFLPPGSNDREVQDFEASFIGRKGLFRLAGESSDNVTLKIDVEGAEWEALALMGAYLLDRKISQLVIKLNLIFASPPNNLPSNISRVYERSFKKFNQKRLDLYETWINYLNDKFYIYNAYNSPFLMDVDGMQYPSSIELSLVRKDLVLAIS